MSDSQKNPLPSNVLNLLYDLELAIGLPSNCRLDINNRKYVSYSIFNSIVRTFAGESRHKTLSWLQDLLERSINVAATYPQCQELITSKVTALSDTILNLKGVYREDPDIVSQLSVLRTQIDRCYFLGSVIDRRKKDGPSEPVNFHRSRKLSSSSPSHSPAKEKESSSREEEDEEEDSFSQPDD